MSIVLCNITYAFTSVYIMFKILAKYFCLQCGVSIVSHFRKTNTSATVSNHKHKHKGAFGEPPLSYSTLLTMEP